MNKKGFTLMELLAVVVILAIISATAIPMIMEHPNHAKKTTYITNVKSFVTAASYMYTLEQYNTEYQYFTKDGNKYTITLDKLTNLSIEQDPFGYDYDMQNSYITFIEPEEYTQFSKRTTTVYVKSCDIDKTKCYCIDSDNEHLTEDKIKTDC